MTSETNGGAMADVIDELFEGNAAARAELVDAMDALAPARREERWYGPEQWSVHDIVAHIIRWQDGFAHALELVAKGERPVVPGFDGGDSFDAFNDVSVTERRGRSWEQLMGELRASRERHEAAARGLRGHVDPERLVPGRATYNLANTAEHDREHAEAIREWRRAQGL